MAKLLTALLLLIGVSAIGQDDDTTRYLKYPGTYGQQMPRIWATKVFRTPSDTIYSKTGLAIKSGTLYAGNGTYWTAVGAGQTASIPPNAGSGYRFYQPQTPAFRSVFPGINALIDSTSNAGALTVHTDTTTGATKLATQGDVDRAIATIGSTDLTTVRDTLSNLFDSLLNKSFRFTDWVNVVDFGADSTGVSNSTAAFNAAGAYLLARRGGDIVIPSGTFKVDSITIPFLAYSASGRLVKIRYIGESGPNIYSDPLTAAANRAFPRTGSIIKSIKTDNGSIFRSAGDHSIWTAMNHVFPVIENLTIIVPTRDASNLNIGAKAKAINVKNVAYFEGRNLRIDTDGPADSILAPESSSAGIILPYSGNFVHSKLENVFITGVDSAIVMYEHATLDNIFIDVCKRAFVMPGTDHSMHINKAVVARSAYTFTIYGSSTQAIKADNVSVERNPSLGKWYDFVADMDEQTPGQAQGSLWIHPVHGSSQFIRTNYVGSRVFGYTPYGNITKSFVDGNRPLNVDTSTLIYNSSKGTLEFNGGATTWREIPWSGQTRNFHLGSGAKLGINTDASTLSSSTYLLNVFDAGATASNLANFESAAAFPNIRLHATNANGQAGLIWAKSGNSKFGIFLDIAGNGTDDLGIYQHTGAATRIHINSSGDVRAGSNALTTPQLVLPVAGNVRVTNELHINQPSDQGAYALQVVGNSHFAGDILLPQNGSTNRNISFGTGFGAAALWLYNGGAAGRYGWGLQSSEMQFFMPATTHVSFNTGGDLQTAGTNEIMRINSTGNVGIGGSPVASAKLELVSTTQGFLPPRMTATQASAISSPAEGLLVYVTDTNGTFTAKGWWGYDGAAWQKLNN